MNAKHEKFNEISNIVLTVLFLVEMVMKLIGLGFKGYVSDKMNIFDGILVLVSIVDILVLISGVRLAVLRAFRLFRIIKLAKSWETLKNLLEIIGDALGAISSLGLLCILCIFIYALLGT